MLQLSKNFLNNVEKLTVKLFFISDSSNSPSNKSDGNVHQETTVYASLLQPSTNGNKAKQFEDTKQEEKKESPAKANSPANDTVLITDEKYISSKYQTYQLLKTSIQQLTIIFFSLVLHKLT